MSSTRDFFTAAFGADFDLYTTVLGLDGKTADAARIRKAYHRRALLYHPDKQNAAVKTPAELEDAKLRFQAVSLAHEILSNKDSRELYDETGEFLNDDGGDADGSSGVDAWVEIFSKLFGKVTGKDIDEFGKKYKGSEEERGDVLRYYVSCKGNLDRMLDCVMLSEEEDKERWVKDYIGPAVEKGEVKDFGENSSRKKNKKSGTKKDKEEDHDDDDDDEETEDEDYADGEEDDDEETEVEEDDEETETEDEEEPPPAKKKNKRRDRKTTEAAKTTTKKKDDVKQSNSKTNKLSKKEREAKEAEELLTKMRGGSLARQRREQSFNSLMANMEARYAGGGGKNNDPQDIPDDEFERIRNGLGNKNKKKSDKVGGGKRKRN